MTLIAICAAPSVAAEGKKLIAKIYNSGFALAHDTYNGLSSASDGKIYYVLSAERSTWRRQMFVFDPRTRGGSTTAAISPRPAAKRG